MLCFFVVCAVSNGTEARTVIFDRKNQYPTCSIDYNLRDIGFFSQGDGVCKLRIVSCRFIIGHSTRCLLMWLWLVSIGVALEDVQCVAVQYIQYVPKSM